MVFDRLQRDLIEHGRHRAQRRQHIDAIPILFNHACYPTHLPDDAIETTPERLIVRLTHGFCFFFAVKGPMFNNTLRGYIFKAPCYTQRSGKEPITAALLNAELFFVDHIRQRKPPATCLLLFCHCRYHLASFWRIAWTHPSTFNKETL